LCAIALPRSTVRRRSGQTGAPPLLAVTKTSRYIRPSWNKFRACSVQDGTGTSFQARNPMPLATTEFEIRANAFGLIGETTSRPIVYWAPSMAALLAAACLAVLACPVPPSHSLSWARLFWTATLYVLSSFMAATAVAFALYAILPRNAALNIRDVALRTSAAAIWFAPLAIFLSEMSMWAIVAAGALVASVTRLMRLYHDFMPGGSEPEALDAVPSGEIFRLLPSSASTRLPFAALCASVAAQAGGVAGFTGHAVFGAALVAISTAVVAWSSGAPSDWQQQRSRAAQSMLRVTLMIALAASFTAGGLMRYLAVHNGFGWGGAKHSRNILVETASSVLFDRHRTRRRSPRRDPVARNS
jgi:hypothetical protein